MGEIIADALGRGCRKFIIGIGGSATNDGGAGMLCALGFGLLDEEGKQVPPGVGGLSKIRTITDKNVPAGVFESEFLIACDVENPLCGEDGCSRVFAPQKGADAETAEKMDGLLFEYSEKVREYNPKADRNFPGAGAAGGMGFARKGHQADNKRDEARRIYGMCRYCSYGRG